ncbi:hypothetical protein, partial [Paenibacillus pinistramenti]|uniref:hypothetical protein n=1 Tax=Paenibacillus pinistramenti TaxID=1768003 RepID=UPI001EF08E18
PGAPSAAAPRKAPPSPAPPKGAGGPAGKTRAQRVFIKIAAAAEDARLLEQLKLLLQQHPGPLPTVLFYESSGRLLALSERYSIKPSPELIKAMESLLGQGTVRIK